MEIIWKMERDGGNKRLSDIGMEIEVQTKLLSELKPYLNGVDNYWIM